MSQFTAISPIVEFFFETVYLFGDGVMGRWGDGECVDAVAVRGSQSWRFPSRLRTLEPGGLPAGWGVRRIKVINDKRPMTIDD